MKLIVFILIISAVSSCTSVYIPSTPNIPLIEDKKELQLNLGGTTTGLAFAGAYALSDKYALIGNAATSYRTFSTHDNIFTIMEGPGRPYDDDNLDIRHWNSELGFGKYKAINKNQVLELYSGLGYGQSESTKSQEANYGSLFLQANFGVKKQYVEFGLAAKVIGSYFSYYYNPSSEPAINESFPVISTQLSGICRIGSENFRFWVSPGVNLSSVYVQSHANELGFVNNDFGGKFNCALGINFRIKIK